MSRIYDHRPGVIALLLCTIVLAITACTGPHVGSAATTGASSPAIAGVTVGGRWSATVTPQPPHGAAWKPFILAYKVGGAVFAAMAHYQTEFADWQSVALVSDPPTKPFPVARQLFARSPRHPGVAALVYPAAVPAASIGHMSAEVARAVMHTYAPTLTLTAQPAPTFVSSTQLFKPPPDVIAPFTYISGAIRGIVFLYMRNCCDVTGRRVVRHPEAAALVDIRWTGGTKGANATIAHDAYIGFAAAVDNAV